MKKQVKDLYKEVIRAHGNTPLFFEKRAEAMHVVEAYNPICGDQFEWYVEVVEEKIMSLYFHGFGCLIAKAAGSVLAKKLQGLSVEEASTFVEQFLDFIDGGEGDFVDKDLLAFGEVRNFPARKTCVTLNWETFRQFIEKL